MAAHVLPRGDWKAFDPDNQGNAREYRSKTYGIVVRSPGRGHGSWYFFAIPKMPNAEQVRCPTVLAAMQECENPKILIVGGKMQLNNSAT